MLCASFRDSVIVVLLALVLLSESSNALFSRILPSALAKVLKGINKIKVRQLQCQDLEYEKENSRDTV